MLVWSKRLNLNIWMLLTSELSAHTFGPTVAMKMLVKAAIRNQVCLRLRREVDVARFMAIA